MPTRLIISLSTHSRLQVALQREGQLFPEQAGPEASLVLPMAAEECEELRWYLEDYLEAPYAVWEDRGNLAARRLRVWGERLFDAVFGHGKVGRDAYVRASEAGTCELWIQSSSASFLGLPWELLQDPQRSLPMALELRGINRTIEVPSARVWQQPGTRLRVLMVISRPMGQDDVGYRNIARPLLERLQAVTGDVRLDVLRPPTLAALRRHLTIALEQGEPYHVLHFDGHGCFGKMPERGGMHSLHYSQGDQQGYLVFETENGGKENVSAEDFAVEIAQAQIPLLVLNACRSGTILVGTSHDAAVATKLLSAGASAVVAMSYTVFAVAAAEFMAAFYDALFKGSTVSHAVTEGRRQLHRLRDRPSPRGPMPLEDWIVPVHYARAEVVFPQLQSRPRQSILPLSEVLAQMRRPQPAEREFLPMEGTLEATGGCFFGRDAEFHELERALRIKKVVVLHGIGGTGKTELVKAFARWLQVSGGLAQPNLVVFHSFEPGLITFGLEGVILATGQKLWGADFLKQERQQRHQFVLDALREQRILLVWDNFETAYSVPDPAKTTPPLSDEQRREIRDFLAALEGGTGGGVLITSRTKEDWLGPVPHRLEVSGLTRQDAAQLADHLLASYPQANLRRADPRYGELLELLGGHPLSMRLLLPHLASVGAAELADGLRGEHPLPSNFAENPGRLDSLAACVHYSFQHLDEIHRRRLPALVIFEGIIDINVLSWLGEYPETPSRFRGVSRQDWQETAESCSRIGLLVPLSNELYQLHPALPSYLLSQWKREAGESFYEEHAAARLVSLRVCAALGDALIQELGGSQAETYISVLTLHQRTLRRMAAAALDGKLWTEALSLLQPLQTIWHHHGLVKEAHAWAERGRTLVEDASGNPPEINTSAGKLWLFLATVQSSYRISHGDIEGALPDLHTIRALLEGAVGEHAQRGLTTAYLNLGRVARAQGKLNDAEEWLNKALAIIDAVGDSCGQSAVYLDLGWVAQHRGNLSQAEAWYRKAAILCEAQNSQGNARVAYHQLAWVAQQQGKLEDAEGLYLRSAQISEALEDYSGAARTFHNLGVLAQIQGRFDCAKDWYQTSLKIAEQLGYQPGVAASYHDLGTLAQAQGDLVTAEAWYRKSLAIEERLGDRRGIASTHFQLARVAQDRGDLEGAESRFRQVMETANNLGDQILVASVYHELGRIAQRLGLWDEAERQTNQSIAINEASGSRPGLAKAFGQMSQISEGRCQPSVALDWLVRGVSLFREFPHPDTMAALFHLARLTRSLGMEALEYSWQKETGELVPEQVRGLLLKFIEGLGQ